MKKILTTTIFVLCTGPVCGMQPGVSEYPKVPCFPEAAVCSPEVQSLGGYELRLERDDCDGLYVNFDCDEGNLLYTIIDARIMGPRTPLSCAMLEGIEIVKETDGGFLWDITEKFEPSRLTRDLFLLNSTGGIYSVVRGVEFIAANPQSVLQQVGDRMVVRGRKDGSVIGMGLLCQTPEQKVQTPEQKAPTLAERRAAAQARVAEAERRMQEQEAEREKRKQEQEAEEEKIMRQKAVDFVALNYGELTEAQLKAAEEAAYICIKKKSQRVTIAEMDRRDAMKALKIQWGKEASAFKAEQIKAVNVAIRRRP